MTQGASQPAKNRRQVEDELLEAVHQTRADWMNANESDRDRARARFINALHSFHQIVLHNKRPDE